MKTSARLALFGAGLVIAFGGAFGVAATVSPDDVLVDPTHGDHS